MVRIMRDYVFEQKLSENLLFIPLRYIQTPLLHM